MRLLSRAVSAFADRVDLTRALPRTPRAGDFDGVLMLAPDSVAVGSEVEVDLTIRNITNHAIEPSLGSLPYGDPRVAR